MKAAILLSFFLCCACSALSGPLVKIRVSTADGGPASGAFLFFKGCYNGTQIDDTTYWVTDANGCFAINFPENLNVINMEMLEVSCYYYDNSSTAPYPYQVGRSLIYADTLLDTVRIQLARPDTPVLMRISSVDENTFGFYPAATFYIVSKTIDPATNAYDLQLIDTVHNQFTDLSSSYTHGLAYLDRDNTPPDSNIIIKAAPHYLYQGLGEWAPFYYGGSLFWNGASPVMNLGTDDSIAMWPELFWTTY